jgi:hypothetical protein
MKAEHLGHALTDQSTFMHHVREEYAMLPAFVGLMHHVRVYLQPESGLDIFHSQEDDTASVFTTRSFESTVRPGAGGGERRLAYRREWHTKCTPQQRFLPWRGLSGRCFVMYILS